MNHAYNDINEFMTWFFYNHQLVILPISSFRNQDDDILTHNCMRIECYIFCKTYSSDVR